MSNLQCSHRRSSLRRTLHGVDSPHALSSLTNTHISCIDCSDALDSRYYNAMSYPEALFASTSHMTLDNPQRHNNFCGHPYFQHPTSPFIQPSHSNSSPSRLKTRLRRHSSYNSKSRSAASSESPSPYNAPPTPSFDGPALGTRSELPDDNLGSSCQYASPDAWPVGSITMDGLHSPPRIGLKRPPKMESTPHTVNLDWSYDAESLHDDTAMEIYEPDRVSSDYDGLENPNYPSPQHFQTHDIPPVPYTSSLSNALSLPSTTRAVQQSPGLQIIHPVPVRPIPINALANLSLPPPSDSSLPALFISSGDSWSPAQDDRDDLISCGNWSEADEEVLTSDGDEASPLPLLCQPISQKVLVMYTAPIDDTGVTQDIHSPHSSHSISAFTNQEYDL